MSVLFTADAVQTATGVHGNAILVEDGKVLAVGPRAELAAAASERLDFGDGVIVPGFRDAHLHPVHYAAALIGTTVGHVADMDELRAVLAEAATGLPDGAPLIATRFDDAVIRERRLPTRHDLDPVAASRPAVVHRYCGHVATANTAALALAGIDADTDNPEGGVIDRDEGGAPTGVLRETAIGLVSTRLRAAVRPSSTDLIDAMTRLAGRGLTSIGAMLGLGDGPWASLGDEVDAIAAVADDLPIKVHGFVIANDPSDLADAKDRLDHAGPRLRWAGLKLFSDGSFGGHTAAMHQPFSDAPTESGTLRWRAIDDTLIDDTLDRGGMVAVHAIGDRANTVVLDRFQALVERGVAASRLRLEHASVLTPADIDRIGRLGVIASVQPAFIGSEVSWLAERMGAERLATTYAFGSLAAAGAQLAGGSDSPVESPDPLAGMALARDRSGIVPDQRLDAAAALALFTSGSAAALEEEEPLASGTPADFVVLDRNPVEVSPDELRKATVLATVIDGEELFVDRGKPLWIEEAASA